MNKLRLEHFKAFRDSAELALDGENVLIFGENGSGKSSLYQALKIIFHRKKMFDSEIPDTTKDPRDRKNAESDILSRYNYQLTPLTPFLLEIDGTSFERFDTTGYNVSMISQEDIKVEDEIDVVNLLKKSYVSIEKPAEFVRDKKNTIETVVNSLLKNYFCEDNLAVTLTYKDTRWVLTIKDKSRDNSARNEKLTEYFNEAKLHIIKLLVLLTAVLYNGAKERGEKRVLVLDDVLTSMDAANRAVFIKLLIKYFDEYQKIVLTHSISFFNLAEHSFSRAYHQKWELFQIVEHEGNSEIVPKQPEDYGRKIQREYHPGRNDAIIGNRVRKHFEYLVREASSLLYTGGIAETSHLLNAIAAPKKLYYEFDNTQKKLNTVYDLVDELTAIIDAAPASPLKSQLEPVIARYASGNELTELRDILSEMVMYQKVSMHPLSHSTGALSFATTRECERSISLLIQLENQLNKLIGRDMYSI